MASGGCSMSLSRCLHGCCSAAAARRTAQSPRPAAAVATAWKRSAAHQMRGVSATAARWRPDKNESDEAPTTSKSETSPANKTEPTADQIADHGRILSELRYSFDSIRRNVPAKPSTFWNEEEPDPEMVTDEQGEDDFHGDDITSMAHGKLQEQRERRHFARITAWEMPLLANLAKPFEPPSSDMVLRFRYTSYMGEFHPAEKKVVVEFCPSDLELTEVQQRKLIKLVGARYNPEKEIVRMSCEMYEHQAQNKRYLGDLVEKLIAEAKDPSDTFEDVPLDFRHHTFKHKPKFPKEWRMTEERRQELQEIRAQAFLLDQKKLAENKLVDGAQRVQAALASPAAGGGLGDRVAELVRLRPGGKQSAKRQ